MWFLRCCSRYWRTELSMRWSPMTGWPTLMTPKQAPSPGMCWR